MIFSLYLQVKPFDAILIHMENTIKEYMSVIGTKGGKKTLEKYGKKHFSELGKKGYLAMKEVVKKKLTTTKPLDKNNE